MSCDFVSSQKPTFVTYSMANGFLSIHSSWTAK